MSLKGQKDVFTDSERLKWGRKGAPGNIWGGGGGSHSRKTCPDMFPLWKEALSREILSWTGSSWPIISLPWREALSWNISFERNHAPKYSQQDFSGDIPFFQDISVPRISLLDRKPCPNKSLSLLDRKSVPLIFHPWTGGPAPGYPLLDRKPFYMDPPGCSLLDRKPCPKI